MGATSGAAVNGDAVKRLQAALEAAGCQPRGSSARCPAHDDRNASLSYGQGRAGAVVKCHAGCATPDVLAALGLDPASLFDDPPPGRGGYTVTATYPYTDEHGTPLYCVERRDPKDFRQYRLVDGRKTWSLKGVTRVPYHLPALLDGIRAGRTVYVAEGEKDVHAIEAAGGTATCNPGGAGKWRPEYAAWFAGAGRVVVIADTDEPGRRHAAQVAAALRPVAGHVEIAEAAAGKDAHDHLAAGHGLGDLRPAGTSEPAETDSGGRVAQLRAALLDSAALDRVRPPAPVIDGFLYADTLAWLHGKPGHGKSFLALDWAGCVAAGLPWQQHETTQGPVLYLAAEGLHSIPPRVRAWEDRARTVMGALFLPVAVQLLDPADREALAELAAGLRPVLVVIDTQARVTVGFDENSARDMGLFVAAADRVRAATGACVLVVHHEPRNGDNMRGSTCLEGAAASILRAVKDGTLVTVTTVKQKDAPPEDPVRLRLLPCLGSAVILSNDAVGQKGFLSNSEDAVITALLDSFVGRSATVADLADTARMPRSTVNWAVSSLVRKGAVVNSGTRARARYELTGAFLSNRPTPSDPTPPIPSNVQPPLKGVGHVGPLADWPENSNGAAANQEPPDWPPPDPGPPDWPPPDPP